MPTAASPTKLPFIGRSYTIRQLLIDRSGQQRVNTLKPYGSHLPRHGNPALLAHVAASGRSEISSLYVGAVTHAGVMSICVPVFIDGQLQYFLDVGVAGPYFGATLAKRELPPDWLVALLDASGTSVARSRGAGRYVGSKTTPQLLAMLPDQRALLGWDGSLQATRAISAAIPLLRRGGLATLAVINPGQDDQAHGAVPGADMACYLARHGIAVEVVQRSAAADPGSALLVLAAELDADLLVIGAYGHSRILEMALGGATRTVLRDMALPVLLAH